MCFRMEWECTTFNIKAFNLYLIPFEYPALAKTGLIIF